jgi:hypothetical protein
MSRKRKRKSTYQRRYKNPLIKGKFYRIMDSSGGHYSRLYKKNTKKNKYWIVRFTDSDGRHRELLLHQIDPALENTGAKSFVITQPQIVKYENFKHPYPYEQLRVHKDDRKKVKRYKRKNELHAPFTAPMCLLTINI